MAYSGKFNPKNPEKYKGNANNIVFRSNWEAMVMRHLDLNPDVIAWSSEELAIQYVSPVDREKHRYYPDFIVVAKTREGLIETRMIEVKPYKQMKPPARPRRITRAYKRALITYQINVAKWRAAKAYCESRDWKFCVLNEHDLGLTKI